MGFRRSIERIRKLVLGRKEEEPIFERLEKHGIKVPEEKRKLVLENRKTVEKVLSRAEENGKKLRDIIGFTDPEKAIEEIIKRSDFLLRVMERFVEGGRKYRIGDVPPWAHYFHNRKVPEDLRKLGQKIVLEQGLYEPGNDFEHREVFESVLNELLISGKLEKGNIHVDLRKLLEFLEKKDPESARKALLKKEEMTLEDLLRELKFEEDLVNRFSEEERSKIITVFRNVNGQIVLPDDVESKFSYAQRILRGEVRIGSVKRRLQEARKYDRAANIIRRALEIWEKAHRHIVPLQIQEVGEGG